MKRIVVIALVAYLFCLGGYGNAEEPVGPAGPESKKPEAGEAPAFPPQGTEIAEIFFADGTVSPDDKYLYVIFDRFLLQYTLPALDIKRKVELDIAVAPITPSISISKDSKFLYILYNGIMYQIDTPTLKIKKRIKITP